MCVCALGNRTRIYDLYLYDAYDASTLSIVLLWIGYAYDFVGSRVVVIRMHICICMRKGLFCYSFYRIDRDFFFSWCSVHIFFTSWMHNGISLRRDFISLEKRRQQPESMQVFNFFGLLFWISFVLFFLTIFYSCFQYLTQDTYTREESFFLATRSFAASFVCVCACICKLHVSLLCYMEVSRTQTNLTCTVYYRRANKLFLIYDLFALLKCHRVWEKWKDTGSTRSTAVHRRIHSTHTHKHSVLCVLLCAPSYGRIFAYNMLL